MGEMKVVGHTPGPWVIGDDGNVYGGRDEQASVFPIAQRMSGANARLIAAAPDLLATLRKARAWVAQYSEIKGHEAASAAMLGVIDTAIAKAEGRS